MKKRLIIIFLGILMLWGVLVVRASFLQLIPYDRLESLKAKQFQTNITLQSRRGAILDRNGRDLAVSSSAYSLYADPKILENPKSLSKKLAKELSIPFEPLYVKLKDSQKRFYWIARQLDKDQYEKIKDWNIRGLAFVEEFKRVYPNDSILSQTLGFVGSEGQGLEGLELELDNLLKGSKKNILMRRDARGRPLLADGLIFTENPDGTEVKLTIDMDLQYNLESELVATVKEFDADSAVGIILDAQTSEILATTTVPTFDANKAARTSAEVRRNRVVTDAFEPGSTMKTLVLATALKNKVATPQKKYFCENGFFKVGDRIIREADAHHAFKFLSVSEILAFSSNIGTTKIAMDLGPEKLRQGLESFGIGSRLGLDMPGEARGILQDLPWKPHLLGNISFGHGVSVTPLQLANAYAVIANGGYLKTPHIIKSIKDSETGEITNKEPQKVPVKVLSTEVANQMRTMLFGVTQGDGTGVNARVPGYTVAGKTGTAQKVDPHGKGYLKGAYISSFAGFIPAMDPRFVIYVAVDNPKKAFYGSQVAAPLFSRVASYAVRKTGVVPNLLVEEKKEKSKKQMALLRKASKEVAKSAVIKNKELLVENQEDQNTVPDLSNLTLRDVIRRVRGKNIQLKISGKGTVSEIIPSAGEPLPTDRKIKVILEQ